MAEIKNIKSDRTFAEYIILVLKGMSMGIADIIPGVSGGTIALITGIYQELLISISNLNLKLLQKLKREGLKSAWQQLNGNFLSAVFAGIFISVISFAKIIKWLLEDYPILVWSFFFGLVLASVLYIAKQNSKWSFGSVFMMIIGIVIAYFITTLDPLVSENSSSLFLFVSGAIAVCAMILPGISGAFILVLLGAYQPILKAINDREISVVFVVVMGALVGLLTFSRVLKWLFSHYKRQTLSILIGFIIGSLNKIWPWKQTLTWRINSQGLRVPLQEQSISPFSFDGNNYLTLSIILSILGFGLILVLEKLTVRKL